MAAVALKDVLRFSVRTVVKKPLKLLPGVQIYPRKIIVSSRVLVDE